MWNIKKIQSFVNSLYRDPWNISIVSVQSTFIVCQHEPDFSIIVSITGKNNINAIFPTNCALIRSFHFLNSLRIKKTLQISYFWRSILNQYWLTLISLVILREEKEYWCSPDVGLKTALIKSPTKCVKKISLFKCNFRRVIWIPMWFFAMLD